jgi:hypothetical protein
MAVLYVQAAPRIQRALSPVADASRLDRTGTTFGTLPAGTDTVTISGFRTAGYLPARSTTAALVLA